MVLDKSTTPLNLLNFGILPWTTILGLLVRPSTRFRLELAYFGVLLTDAINGIRYDFMNNEPSLSTSSFYARQSIHDKLPCTLPTTLRLFPFRQASTGVLR